jgi:hypothetical protein
MQAADLSTNCGRIAGSCALPAALFDQYEDIEVILTTGNIY